jgi:beta-mannanase
VGALPAAGPPPPAAAATPLALGIYDAGHATGSTEAGRLAQLETALGHRLAIVQTFSSWESSDGSAVPFPSDFATAVRAAGATPMITWQPQRQPGSWLAPGQTDVDQPAFDLAALASGRYDAYVTSWADAAKAFGGVVFVRLMHEMNGDWYPWGQGVNGNTGPAQYVAAWRHVVGIFQAQGATNVRFVWCASGSATLTALPALYPGDATVSWIAFDDYNRDRPWQTFTQLATPVYDTIAPLTTRPMMVAETATPEEAGSPSAKASWITSTFLQEIPASFPRVEAALYFDSNGAGMGYQLTTSPAALAAFAGVAASPLYQGPPPT